MELPLLSKSETITRSMPLPLCKLILIQDEQQYHYLLELGLYYYFKDPIPGMGSLLRDFIGIDRNI